VWDEEEQDFVSLLTVVDFLQLLINCIQDKSPTMGDFEPFMQRTLKQSVGETMRKYNHCTFTDTFFQYPRPTRNTV
jgi:hypothetical protein